MILPGSFIVSLSLLILSLLCVSSWPNTFKSVARRWRFELYYWDFAVGFLLASLIAAFTFGSLGQDGFSFIDDVMLAGKRQDFFAFLAGMTFNLGNMLFVAAIYVAGISAAAPVALGVAVIMNALLGPLTGSPSNPLMRFGGAAIMLVAVVGGVIAYRRWAMARLVEAMQTGKTRSTRKIVSSKPVFLSIMAGLLIGGSATLIQMGNDSEIRLGAYSISFVFALGLFLSTFGFNLFFMNLPVQGKPAEMADYFKAKVSAHLIGLAGGAIALVGLLAGILAMRADGAARLKPELSFALSQGPVVIALLWGLIFWKEYESEDSSVNTWVVVTIIFLLAGIGLLAFGQLPPVQAK
jgi:glucose uptake protein